MPSSFSIAQHALDTVSPSSKECLERLIAHNAEISDLSVLPKSKLAAVLVLLFEKGGQLRVLLTTRSKRLRTHPGQTALPGGRVDETDDNCVETALREANEEVGLPLSSSHVHPVCLLRPYVSKYKLYVTPVVAFLDDPAILDTLTPSPDEVDHIFDYPLAAFLDPNLARSEPLAPLGSEDWPYSEELYNHSDSVISAFGNISYRMHRFRSSSSPIKGLTADIMISVASIAYGQAPSFEQHAPGQPTDFGTLWMILRAIDEKATATIVGQSKSTYQSVAA